MIATNQNHEANIGSWRRLENRDIVVKEQQVDENSGELNVYIEAIYQHHYSNPAVRHVQASKVLQLFQQHEFETVQTLLEYLGVIRR